MSDETLRSLERELLRQGKTLRRWALEILERDPDHHGLRRWAVEHFAGFEVDDLSEVDVQRLREERHGISDPEGHALTQVTNTVTVRIVHRWRTAT